jgi:hypothetical protein
MTNPIENEELYEVVVLGGARSPGVVQKIEGHESPVKWDVKNAKGQSGASVTLKEVPLREPKITIFLADLDDINAWPAWRKVVESTTEGATPKALDVYHPDLAEHGITSVVKANVAGPTHDGKGGQTYVVTLQEYRPPKPKSGSPSGSKKSQKKENDPDAAALAELEKVTKQYTDTPWG